ncbi:MAG: 30S ribosomal protein S1, partial [Candidatus Riesia sp.]|nr:30S ribosomal protein S1 [Candidatus Riesia sp.]
VSDKLKDFYYKNKPLLAMVTEMKPAGFMLDIEMDNVIVNAFMPTTLAGINKLTDDQKDEIIGQKIYVMLETLQMDKGIYVVSRKKYLKTLIKDELKKLKEEFDKNRNVIYDGTVTGTTPFGIFVEFNKCLTGMIHRYNVNEQWTGDDKWGDIKPGMVIQFYVKDIIVKKQKVILTQILRESLWDTIKKDKVMDGTVYDIKSFGVLVKLDEETNGLIQSSYLNKNNVNLSIGHNVKVRVLNVIKDDRKIYLGIVKNK